MRELAKRLVFDVNERQGRFTHTRTRTSLRRFGARISRFRKLRRFWKPRNCAAH